MTPAIPEALQASCLKTATGLDWLETLPTRIHTLTRRWSLCPGQPYSGEEVSCSWVAPVTQTDGTAAVLKLGMPHMEGRDEIAGLRFWNGDPTVRLLAADEDLGAMLLERAEPGTPLRQLDEPEQDRVIARLLRRLWRRPGEPRSFRPLSSMLAYWSGATRADEARWPDPGLVSKGLRTFEELSRTSEDDVLLATDLHAGNVIRAQREPWLVIDPKPFLGDPAYDLTQHLFNCMARLRSKPDDLISSVSELAGVDTERVRLWTFARAAAEPRADWNNPVKLSLARAIAP